MRLTNVDDYLYELKWYIRHEQYDEFFELWSEIQDAVTNKELEYRISIEYIFLKAYLCAVCYNKTNLKEWFEKEYEKMDPVTQIALGPTFVYAKYVTPRQSNLKH